MSWLRRNPLALLLAVAAVALVAVLAAELTLGPGEAEDAEPKRGPAPEAKLLPPAPQVNADQAYAETTARPLFVPARRPAPAAPTVAAPVFQRGQFTLHGVIVAGNTRTAMLREKANGKIHRVEQGREVNGIKVVQIDPVQVVIGMGEEVEVVPLTVQRPGGVPGVSVAPAPVAQAGQQGPFGSTGPPFPTARPGEPATTGPGFARPPGVPAPPPGIPGAPGATPATPGGVAPGAPGAPNTPQATTAPMSPEELLARRRARRTQQTQ